MSDLSKVEELPRLPRISGRTIKLKGGRYLLSAYWLHDSFWFKQLIDGSRVVMFFSLSRNIDRGEVISLTIWRLFIEIADVPAMPKPIPYADLVKASNSENN